MIPFLNWPVLSESSFGTDTHTLSFVLIHILWNDHSVCAVEFLSLWVGRSCCGTCPTRGKAPTLLELEVRVFWAIGCRIHRLEFQMLAHTEEELFPKEKRVMKNTREGDFPDKGLLLTLIISSLSFWVWQALVSGFSGDSGFVGSWDGHCLPAFPQILQALSSL